VRGVQVHGHAADAAVAGQRTALNIAGASVEDLSRGMTLAPPGTFCPTRLVDVQLRLLKSAPRALKNRTRVHFHSGTMETVAELRPYGSGKEVAPGEVSFARVKLPGKALLLPGDRFIIRQFSPVVTIGGGVLLDAAPPVRASQNTDLLRVLAEGDAESILRARIVRRGHLGISFAQLIAETGWTRRAIEGHLARAQRNGELLRIGDLILNAEQLASLKLSAQVTIEEFHKKNPLERGIAKEPLREKVKATEAVFNRGLDDLVRERRIEISGDLVRLPGHGVVMKDEEAESKKKIEDAFATAGLKVPALHEVLAGLKVDKARAQKIVTLLLRDKVLIKISDELVFHRTALEELRRLIAAQKAKSPKMDVAKFKELTGVSRKYAIPLLEYLDRERVTRRVGDAREIL